MAWDIRPPAVSTVHLVRRANRNQIGLRGILKEYNFRIKDIKYWKTPPKPWPQSGFQIGTVWFERGFIDINNLKINFYE
jgi:hypothetical protein